MKKLKLSCSCGKVQGTALGISGDTGNRCICMCDDCQAYAHFLGGDKTYLDSYGGTEIFQLTPSQIKIESGSDHIKCLRLTKKGLMRWYAGCCNTPIANTAVMAKFPFCGILFPFIAESNETKNKVMGPVIAKVWGKFAKGDMPNDANRLAPPSYIFRFLGQMFRGWVTGKARPNPFFVAQSGLPLSAPHVLSEQENSQLYLKLKAFNN